MNLSIKILSLAGLRVLDKSSNKQKFDIKRQNKMDIIYSRSSRFGVLS